GGKVVTPQRARAEDGFVVHDDRAGRHEAGAVDLHTVSDVDSRVGTEREQRGLAGRTPDAHVTTEADAPAPADAQSPRARKARPEGMARITQAQVQRAEAHRGRGSAREGS